ncbi:hypothetical protein [Streptomyces scopuliridis]
MGQSLGRRALLVGTGGLLMGAAGCSGPPSAPVSAPASGSDSPSPSSSLPPTTP